MKKQLLIAAVAATMTSVAMADISITGSAKANYTNTDSTTEASDTNAFDSEINLGIKGTNGGSGVVVNLQSKNSADNDGFDVQDSYITSSVADVAVQFGSWRGSHNLLEDGDTTSANRFKASTTVGGVTLTYEDSSTGAESVKLSGDIAGVSVAHKMYNDGAGTDTTDTAVSGAFSGVNAAYRSIDVDGGTSSDKESFEISTDMNGISVGYAQFEMGTGSASSQINSDGALGDIDANEASGVIIKSAMAGNTVKLVVADKKASETAADDSITKVVVTRPLASGATFEATYTDTDNASGADTKVLDLELAVKF